MRPPEARYWSLLLILLLPAASLGCQPLKAATAPDDSAPAAGLTSPSVTIDEEIEFGPGSLDLPDMRVGLADASSYDSRLVITFEGTRSGQPLNWSGTYSYAATREPLSRQLMIETTGEGAEPQVQLFESKGVAYEKPGEDVCMADLIDPVNSAVDALEPAAQLPSLFGAEEAGTEPVNGLQAAHYTFDERALTEAGVNKSTGELWLASEGGYVLRYRQTTTGDASYFGQGTEGKLTYDYELTQVNQPTTITLPADCPPGLLDAPILTDASKAESLPGLLEYQTTSSVQDVVAFYQQELPKLGWGPPDAAPLPEGMSPEEYQQALEMLKAMGLGLAGQPTPTPDPNDAFLLFQRGDDMMRVSITRQEAVTQVLISAGPKPGGGQ